MKAKVHPTWYEDANVTCACGNKFHFGTTVSGLQVEVCSACHPFFTGQMKFVDKAGRVDSFKIKQQNAAKKVLSKADRRKLKRERRIREEMDRPDTLEALRKPKKSKKAKKN